MTNENLLGAIIQWMICIFVVYAVDKIYFDWHRRQRLQRALEASKMSQLYRIANKQEDIVFELQQTVLKLNKSIMTLTNAGYIPVLDKIEEEGVAEQAEEQAEEEEEQEEQEEQAEEEEEHEEQEQEEQAEEHVEERAEEERAAEEHVEERAEQ